MLRVQDQRGYTLQYRVPERRRLLRETTIEVYSGIPSRIQLSTGHQWERNHRRGLEVTVPEAHTGRGTMLLPTGRVETLVIRGTLVGHTEVLVSVAKNS